jgi:hypothetical protein
MPMLPCEIIRLVFSGIRKRAMPSRERRYPCLAFSGHPFHSRKALPRQVAVMKLDISPRVNKPRGSILLKRDDINGRLPGNTL